MRSAAPSPPEEPDVRPTLPWLAAQLVPSPSVATGRDGGLVGMSWQVTPVSFAYAVHRGLSPWRSFVVEPNLRQGGSMELYLSPEVHFGGRSTLLLLRPGVRSYVPLVEHGEYLSASVGVSFQDVGDRPSAAFEAGAYVLFGIVGVQIAHAPAPRSPLRTMATLRLRYF